MIALRLVIVLCTSIAFCAVAEPLPPSVAAALMRAKIPLEDVGVVVKEVGAKESAYTLNADKAMNPASVIKLVTTYAGLELLGPAYTWRTEVSIAGEMRHGKLTGDIVLKGYGDPKLSVERFWMLLRQLRERGLSTINGDLILDRSFFDAGPHDPAKFDGEALRSYNVGPDPLLLNFKTVRFFFTPSVDDKLVSISPDVRPAQLEIVNRVKLIEGPCGDWRERVITDIQTPSPIKLKVIHRTLFKALRRTRMEYFTVGPRAFCRWCICRHVEGCWRCLERCGEACTRAGRGAAHCDGRIAAAGRRDP